MSLLVVVAHPDDEALGCGALATALASQGTTVRSCILCSGADARRGRPERTELMDNIKKAHDIMGIQEYILGDFPNIQMNTVPHIELVRFIEDAISKTKADIIFTHHPHDLNDDHRHTSTACQAAVRLFQRRSDIPRLKRLYYMEILSSTEWSFPGNGDCFKPDTYFEMGETLLEKKISALKAYQGVVRDFPHPRSVEILKGLAALRGGQAGMQYAEAFQTAFHSVDANQLRE